MFKDFLAQRLTALFIAGWFMLNFPLLGLWDVDGTWFGIPIFLLALFLWWAALIALSAWLLERRGQSPQDE